VLLGRAASGAKSVTFSSSYYRVLASTDIKIISRV